MPVLLFVPAVCVSVGEFVALKVYEDIIEHIEVLFLKLSKSGSGRMGASHNV